MTVAGAANPIHDIVEIALHGCPAADVNQYKPPAREGIDGSGTFCQQSVAVQRANDDSGSQSYAPGDGCEGSQGCQGLVAVVDEPVNHSQAGKWSFINPACPFDDELPLCTRYAVR